MSASPRACRPIVMEGVTDPRVYTCMLSFLFLPSSEPGRFAFAGESLNSTGTCSTRHPLQGSPILPLCLVGRSNPPGFVVISTVFFRHLPFPRPLPSTATSSSDHTVSSSPAMLEFRLCPARHGPSLSSTRGLPLSSAVDIVLHLHTLIDRFAINEDQLCDRSDTVRTCVRSTSVQCACAG